MLDELFTAIQDHSKPVQTRTMDIFISEDKAVVKKRKQIEVTFIPTYDVYVKNGLFDFGRIPF